MNVATKFFRLFCIFSVVASCAYAEDNDTPKYATGGYSATTKLGGDLFNALKEKYRDGIVEKPVSLDTDVSPFIKPVEYPDEKKPLRMVFISVGFLDLINHVAHAKAIDKIEPGYFEKYVLNLAEEKGDTAL